MIWSLYHIPRFEPFVSLPHKWLFWTSIARAERQTKYSKTCHYLTPGDKALSRLLFTNSPIHQFTNSGPIGDGTEWAGSAHHGGDEEERLEGDHCHHHPHVCRHVVTIFIVLSMNLNTNQKVDKRYYIEIKFAPEERKVSLLWKVKYFYEVPLYFW